MTESVGSFRRIKRAGTYITGKNRIPDAGRQTGFFSHGGRKLKKHQKDFEENREDSHIREFLDMIAPSVIRFETDHFICGNTYRCVWAIREYPTATDEQAILSHLGEKDGVTLHIYTRHVTAMEEKGSSATR